MPVSRPSERLAFLALFLTIAFGIQGSEPVRKAYMLTHNTLGSTEGRMPTADLFMWTAFALIVYFGTKMWDKLAAPVFALPPERAALWQDRLRWTRLVAMLLCLGFTVATICRYGYNFK